jgi:hypothetical protein
MNSRIEQLQFFQSTSLEKAKQEFDSLLANSKIKQAVYSSFFLCVFAIFLPLLFIQKIPPEIPLLFSRPWGQERLVNKGTFLVFPLIIFVFLVINFRFASIFFKKQKLLSQLIIWTSLIISLFTAITVIQIMLITVF